MDAPDSPWRRRRLALSSDTRGARPPGVGAWCWICVPAPCRGEGTALAVATAVEALMDEWVTIVGCEIGAHRSSPNTDRARLTEANECAAFRFARTGRRPPEAAITAASRFKAS